MSSSKSSQQEDDGGSGIQESFDTFNVGLELLCQFSVPVDPSEEPLDDPATGDNGDSCLLIGLVDDLDMDRTGFGDPRAGITAFVIGECHSRPARTRGLEQGHHPIAVLNGRRMGLQFELPTVGVDHGMAFAALNLFAGGVATTDAAFGRPDALTIDHRRCRTRFMACPFQMEHDQMVVDPFPCTIVAEPDEPSINRWPGRKVLWQQAPSVDDFPHLPLALSSSGPRWC